MVSVDDLVISLRIDETSNLGNLQKQLEALVGKKGEKKFDLGEMSPSMKRELTEIKTNLRFISNQIVPDITSTRELSENIHRDRKALEKTFTDAAERLISEKTDAYQTQLKEFGIEPSETARDELIKEMESKLENFIGMMQLAEVGLIPAGVMQKIDYVAKMLLGAEKLKEGPRKTLLDALEKAIGELNEMFSQVLDKANIRHKKEFTLYQIRKSWYREMEEDWMDLKFDIDTFIGTNEKVLDSYEKIKDFVKDKGGITEFLNKAFEKLGIKPTLEVFTKEAIKKSPELEAIAKGMFIKGFGTKYGFYPGFHSYIAEQLADKFGLTVTDMWEQGRPDFLLIDNKLEDLRKIFPEDMAKRLAKAFTFIELKSVLSEANKEQFKRYKDMVGAEYLTGVAAIVKKSFSLYFPEIATHMVNIVNLLKELAPEMFASKEQLDILSTERMDEMEKEFEKEAEKTIKDAEIKLNDIADDVKEGWDESMWKFLEEGEEFSKPESIEDALKRIEKQGKESGDKLDDLVDGFEEMDDIVDENNKILKEDMNKPDIEKEEDGD